MYITNKELHLVWCIEDVIHTAKQYDIIINENQALEVLKWLLDTHDCNHGTTWDDVRQGINEVINK